MPPDTEEKQISYIPVNDLFPKLMYSDSVHPTLLQTIYTLLLLSQRDSLLMILILCQI